MLEFTFSTPGSFPFKVHDMACLFNEALGERALMLAFGNTREIVAFDFWFGVIVFWFQSQEKLLIYFSCSCIFILAS